MTEFLIRLRQGYSERFASSRARQAADYADLDLETRRRGSGPSEGL